MFGFYNAEKEVTLLRNRIIAVESKIFVLEEEVRFLAAKGLHPMRPKNKPNGLTVSDAIKAAMRDGKKRSRSKILSDASNLYGKKIEPDCIGTPLTSLVNSGFLKRVSCGVYQLNRKDAE